MNNKEKNFISAVIYVRNDEKNIASFLDKINAVFQKNFLKYELIFVNDGSLDKTVDIIKREAGKQKNGSISILNMSYYQGKELAMNAGIDLSIGDFVYQFESIEIDYDLDLIMQIYKKSLEGNDIVFATPNQKMRFSSKLFYHLFNSNSGFNYDLQTITLEIISRRAINRINGMNKTILYRKAVEANCGLKILYVNYDVVNNVYSKLDKNRKKERKKNATDSLILFTDVSYKFSIVLTFIMFIIALFMSVYAIYINIIGKPIEGWTTIILFLSFGFAGLFLLYAIVLKYLSLIISLIFKKSDYLVNSIEKLN